MGSAESADGGLDLLWDANHRLAESRSGAAATRYGYDPAGRRVFKRGPTQTTWFFWDGNALLGEMVEDNDAPRPPLASPSSPMLRLAGARQPLASRVGGTSTHGSTCTTPPPSCHWRSSRTAAA